MVKLKGILFQIKIISNKNIDEHFLPKQSAFKSSAQSYKKRMNAKVRINRDNASRGKNLRSSQRIFL